MSYAILIMEAFINSFSCDLFWFKVTPNFITFGSKDLPDKVHVTVAFNGNNDTEINLHISKNTPAKDKPKITVATVKKSDLDDVFPFIGKAMLSCILTRVDHVEFKKIYDNFHIINNSRKKRSREIEKQLIRIFKPISRLTKNRTKLEIRGSLNDTFDSFQKGLSMKKFVPDSMEFGVQKKIKSGLVAFQDAENYYIKIDGRWFKMNSFTINGILISILGRALANVVIEHFYRSLNRIQSCKSYSDSREFDKPIRLYKTGNG